MRWAGHVERLRLVNADIILIKMLKRRNYLGDLGKDGMIILKLMSKSGGLS
jgi:hypothetical protein